MPAGPNLCHPNAQRKGLKTSTPPSQGREPRQPTEASFTTWKVRPRVRPSDNLSDYLLKLKLLKQFVSCVRWSFSLQHLFSFPSRENRSVFPIYLCFSLQFVPSPRLFPESFTGRFTQRQEGTRTRDHPRGGTRDRPEETGRSSPSWLQPGPDSPSTSGCMCAEDSSLEIFPAKDTRINISHFITSSIFTSYIYKTLTYTYIFKQYVFII